MLSVLGLTRKRFCILGALHATGISREVRSWRMNVFPSGSVGGMDYLKPLRPLPNASFIPLSGVTP